MALSETDLETIGQELAASQSDSTTFAALREKFPALSWTRCDAADVDEEPYRSVALFDLHLLDTTDHCPRIVTEPGAANGIILAKRRNPA
ncbi:hypothetical protein [Breoghania sp. JC706]|uniref:hypothetical protein n=1 Tax=Breoghania sp. JC706 TaxID=3117732 RepID=UPI003009BC48